MFAAEGTSIVNEPYEFALIGENIRNYIGWIQWWDTGNANDNADYCGLVDDFRLYDIALTQDEIQVLQAPTRLYKV